MTFSTSLGRVLQAMFLLAVSSFPPLDVVAAAVARG